MPQEVPFPKDINDAVFMIPEDLHPFGSDCHISKPVQSVMHHYGVVRASLDVLEEEEFFLIRDLKMADPDGEAVCRALFADAIGSRIPGRLQRMKVHFAVRRLLRPDPFAAIVATPAAAVVPAAAVAPAADAPPPPPPKRRRVTAAPTASASGVSTASSAPADGSSSSAPASRPSSSSSAAVRDTLDGLVGPSDDDSDDDDADDEDDGAADDAADADGVERDDVVKDDSKPSKRKDVVTLFNDLANEVNVNSRWVAFFLTPDDDIFRMHSVRVGHEETGRDQV